MKHTVRIIFVLVPALIVLGGLSSGCAPTESEPVVVRESPVVLADSSPNWDLITFGDAGGLPTYGTNPQLIGNAILMWEKSHPDRRIVSMQILYQQVAYATPSTTVGISIYSELK